MSALKRHLGSTLVCIASAISVAVPPGVVADETDNFYLPTDAKFADLGPFLESLHTDAVTRGVRRVNSRIDHALKIKIPEQREAELWKWHSPDALARAVADEFGDALTETTRIERMLHEMNSGRMFPGQIAGHADRSMNFKAHAIYDPRAVLNLLQGSTIKADGVYFGTDKLLHFHQVGYRYYHRYREHLAAGLDAEAARREMLMFFGERGFFAEARGFGSGTTGIYSNGDMASNYAGWKFYLNLAEPVTLRGVRREPLAVRCGVFWRVNDHVRPESGWFAPFISDHWNEALNPSFYERGMRERVRHVLESRARRIVEFYTVRDGRPSSVEYFEGLAKELSLYDGEDYGHSGRIGKLMHIGNTCIPMLKKDSGATPGL